MKWRQKVLAAGMAVMLTATGLLTACGQTEKQNKNEIVVFNYGDYIDTDVLKQFEQARDMMKSMIRQFSAPGAKKKMKRMGKKGGFGGFPGFPGM